MKNKRYLRITAFLAVFAIILSFSVQAYAENEYQLTALSGQGEVTIESLNVRLGPGTEYDVIGLVKEGEAVAVTGQTDNGWYQIDYQGTAGFVSGKYITVVEQEPASEEEAKASPRIALAPLVPVLIVFVIAAVAVMMIFTIRSFRKDSFKEREEEDGEDEAYETEEDEYLEEEDEEETEEKKAGQEPESETAENDNKESAESNRPRTVVIREEDYQLHIDPKYFEDDEPIEQPESIYDSKGEVKAEALEKAMAKLEELQEEIERLKQKQENEKDERRENDEIRSTGSRRY